MRRRHGSLLYMAEYSTMEISWREHGIMECRMRWSLYSRLLNIGSGASADRGSDGRVEDCGVDSMRKYLGRRGCRYCSCFASNRS